MINKNFTSTTRTTKTHITRPHFLKHTFWRYTQIMSRVLEMGYVRRSFFMEDEADFPPDKEAKLH